MTLQLRELILEISPDAPRRSPGNIVESFGERLTFIHGKRDMGKSNLLRLVDFCFGGRFPEDQMSRDWIDLVRLNLDIAGNPATIERRRSDSKVWVYFTDDQGEQAVQMPVRPVLNPEPIYKSATYLSELLLQLTNFPSLKVNVNRDGDTSQERVGFRDVLRFTYLDGAHGVDHVYGLRLSGKSIKARQALRYVLGTYSEKRNSLEEQIDAQKAKLRDQKVALSHSRGVLDHFGIGGENEYEGRVEKARKTVDGHVQRLSMLDTSAMEEHPDVAPLFSRGRDTEKQLDDAEESVELLASKVEDQGRLYNQLTSYIARGAKAAAAKPVIETARIVSCPACHQPTPQAVASDACHVCHRETPPVQNKESMQAAILYLRRQREEAAQATSRLEILLQQAKRRRDSIRAKKEALDQQLSGLLGAYETRTSAQRSSINQELGEARRSLQQLLSLAEDVKTYERGEARLQRIEARIEDLEKALRQEAQQDQMATRRRTRLQDLLREAWIDCGLSIGPDDSVEIPDSTLIPQVRPFGRNPPKDGPMPREVDDFQAVGQATASLRTACLMVAIHQLAEEEGVPLPKLLIMDTPTAGGQNEANLDARVAFYKFLWDKLQGALRGHQVIIVAGDRPAVDPPFNFLERHMTPDKTGPNPPLLR